MVKFFYFSNITSKKNLGTFIEAMKKTGIKSKNMSLDVYGKVIDIRRGDKNPGYDTYSWYTLGDKDKQNIIDDYKRDNIGVIQEGNYPNIVGRGLWYMGQGTRCIN